MTENTSYCLRLPQKLYKILKRFRRKRKSPQWLVKRSQIILGQAKGKNLREIAQKLGIDRKTARLWLQRWKEGLKILSISLGEASPKSLEKRIKTLLSDAPRSGTPAQFKSEQITQIIAIACEDPEKSGRPKAPLDSPRNCRRSHQTEYCGSDLDTNGESNLVRDGHCTSSKPLLAKCYARLP